MLIIGLNRGHSLRFEWSLILFLSKPFISPIYLECWSVCYYVYQFTNLPNLLILCLFYSLMFVWSVYGMYQTLDTRNAHILFHILPISLGNISFTWRETWLSGFLCSWGISSKLLMEDLLPIFKLVYLLNWYRP